MRRARRAAATASAAGLALTLSACLSGDADPASATSTQTTGAGRQLTAEEAELALPIRADLGVRAYLERDPAKRDPHQSTYPAVCSDTTMLGNAVESLGNGDEVTAYREFNLTEGGLATAHITSYAAPVPATPFEAAGDSIGECSSFRLMNKNGEWDYDLASLAVPSLGDHAHAFHVEATPSGREGRDTATDVIVVSRGHHLVRVTYGSYATDDRVPDLALKITRVVLKNLEDS